MIIIINGPMGSGKTSASWALMKALKPSAMLDGDHLVSYHPFDYKNESDLNDAYLLFKKIMQHHLDGGKEYLILNYVFESAKQLKAMNDILAPLNQPILNIRLDLDERILKDRIRKRNNQDNLSWELFRGPQLKYILEKAAEEGDMGELIDSSYLSTRDVVESILSLIEGGLIKS